MTWSVVDPEGHARGEGFRSFLVHRSHSGNEPVLTGLNGLRFVPGEGPQELRMAVALSILDLAEGIGRRAVVVLVASGEEDKGALSETVVESLSTSLSVPVVVFTLGVGKSPAFPRALPARRAARRVPRAPYSSSKRCLRPASAG